MSEVTLLAETGRTIGSRSSGRVRAEGRIPAVVYGHGMDPLPISIVRRDLRAALRTDAGMNAVIDLQVGSDRHLTIVKDVQRHPVRNEVVHVDFLIVRLDEVVTVDTPIVLQGEAAKVKEATGTVDQQLFSLTVKTTPGNIPNELVVDVSEMDIGDAIRVGDLQLPSGVETDVDPEETIATAQITRATIEAEELEEEEAAAAAEAAEGEGEAGEDGEESSGGDAASEETEG